MDYSSSLVLGPGFSIGIWPIVRGRGDFMAEYQVFSGAKSFWPVTDVHGHEL